MTDRSADRACFQTVEELAARIPDGASVAVPARLLRLRDGGGASADPPGRPGPRADLRAAGRPPGRHADRRRLRRRDRDVGRDARRVRPGPAVSRGRVEGARHDPRLDLPGDSRRPPGGREGRAVHAVARDPGLGRPGAPGRLARHRQPVRRGRSHPAPAGDPAGRRRCFTRPSRIATATSGSASGAS